VPRDCNATGRYCTLRHECDVIRRIMKNRRTLITAAMTALVLWGAPSGLAQPAPAFDVATVKPTPETDSGDFQPSIVLFPPGGFRRTNSTLRTLVRTAYGVQPYQVSGGPSWADDDRYDIEAKSDAQPDRAQTLRMLQTLLGDRFKLQVRRETRDGPIYNLVVSSTGSKLKSVAESTSADVRVGRYTGRRTTTQLADYLSGIVGRPVANRTNLEGIFDIQIEFAPDPANAAGVPIFTALREQLGLQLEATRGPVDTIAIVSAQKPTPN
jgi:uncharacterized protein (TIGR03435 family)